MKIRMIVSDLDGTLLTKKKEISELTKEMLKEAVKRGIQFVPATGRALKAVPKEVLEIPGTEYVITSNGAAIDSLSKRKRVYEALMEEASVEKILKLVSERDQILEAYVQGEPYADARYVAQPLEYGSTEYGAIYVKQTRHAVSDMKTFIYQNRKRLDGMAFVCKEENKMFSLHKELEKEVSGIYLTSSVPRLLEVAHKDAGKGTALKWLLNDLSILPEETAAFGDGDNDKEMLEMVRYGIGMANGTKTCKQAAIYVTKSNDEDGVGIALKQLLTLEKADN